MYKFESHFMMSCEKKIKNTFIQQNISRSLQKLRQYNKIVRKNQTNINTAINTNELKSQKNWNFKILKGIVY